MRDIFLFLFGGTAGMAIVSLIQIGRELYGFHKEDQKCALCGIRNPDGCDEDLGPVCAKCEVELSEVGACLMRLSNKI